MHVHVLGLGPIGTLVAHHIRQQLRPPHVVSLIHKTQARADRAQKELGGQVIAEYNNVPIPESGYTRTVGALYFELLFGTVLDLATTTSANHTYAFNSSPH